MVKVLVKFFGLSHLTNGEKKIVLEAFSILDILKEMKNRYAQFRKTAFDPQTGRLYPEFMIVVNGKSAHDLTQKLDEGAVVTIVPIFAGG